MFFIIIFTYSSNKLLVYTYFIICILYVLPIIFFSTIMFAENLKKIKNQINAASLSRNIKIKAIIQNDVNNPDDLQSTINYV